MSANARAPEIPAASILVVEASRTQAEHLCLLLEEAGYRVDLAGDGAAALAAMARRRPAAVISDIVMPGMDGYALCRAIKADPELRDIPVVLVTDLSSPHDIFRSLACGADNFIRKPYDEAVLLSRLRHILANRELRRTVRLQAGVEVELAGQRHFITAERQQILDLLVSSYEEAVQLHEALLAEKRQLGERVAQRTAELRAEIAERERAEQALRTAYAALAQQADGRERTNEALRASERRYRALVEASGTIIWRADPLGLVQEVHGWEALTGQPDAAMRGLGWLDALHPEDRERVKDAWTAARAEARPLQEEFRVRTRGGEGWHWTLSHGVPVFDEQKRLVEWVGVVEDITRRRRADEDLRRTQAFLDQVIENVPVSVFVKDASELRFMLMNRAAKNMLGLQCEEAIGKNDYDFFPKEQADFFIKCDRQVLDSGEILIVKEEPLDTSHHGRRQLRTTKVRMVDESGRPNFLLCLSEDITERLSVEDQLRQAQKMEAVGKLTGGVAHDFNNLLGIVIGNLDLLREQATIKPDTAEILDEALDAALRGADLTRRLLAFARRQPLQSRQTDVNTLIAGTAKLLARTLGASVEVRLSLAANLGAVLIDPAQLEAALTNLAVNARDAMPKGGHLTIATRQVVLDADYAAQHIEARPGNYVVIEVSDNGTGMPPEVRSRAFEPFFTTKEPGKGTGLGLSMVFGFVKQSGGHVEIYSEVGHGTTMRLYLPRTDAVGDDAPGGAEDDGPISQGYGTVLAVEDNEKLRKVLVRQLSELGYTVIEAENAPAALALLKDSTPIDLLLTDIIMPGGMSGWELAREAAQMRPGLKTLFTSGFPDAALSSEGALPEGALLLSKPYRKKDLARMLRETTFA
jgi:PAS domain S-box-containing protein